MYKLYEQKGTAQDKHQNYTHIQITFEQIPESHPYYIYPIFLTLS